MNFITLDKQSKIPLYQQLADSFMRAIEAHQLLPEQRLPSEEVLCQTFGISRSVVKLAYDQLEHNQWIQRLPKGGTFVAYRNTYPAILKQVPYFIEALQHSGLNWTTHLNLKEITQDQHHVKFTTFIEQIPMMVSDAWVMQDIQVNSYLELDARLKTYTQKTEFKAIVLNKVEAQFFNQTEAYALYEFNSYFYDHHTEVARLRQWVSPMMGEVTIEVTHGL